MKIAGRSRATRERGRGARKRRKKRELDSKLKYNRDIFYILRFFRAINFFHGIQGAGASITELQNDGNDLEG